MFFQAEDGIRDLVRSRGLGDVYKRQITQYPFTPDIILQLIHIYIFLLYKFDLNLPQDKACLLYTSDAADERSSVDLGGRRIIKKKTNIISGIMIFIILKT